MYSEWSFRVALRSIALARAISKTLNAYACAFVAALVAIVLLTATWRARRMPDGGPIAQLRRK